MRQVRRQAINDEELFEQLDFIELRQGVQRDVRSYVLRGRNYGESEKQTVRKYLEKHAIFYKDSFLDWEELFGNSKPVVIEIGFGMGDTTKTIALQRPEYNYIGIEVFLEGFIKLLKQIGDNGIDNLRIMRFNAVDVLNHMVKDGSVSGFHVFFPDPWPKKKHHKRRLMSTSFLNLLSTKLVPGGYIYMATDWEPYAQEVLENAEQTETLENPYGGFSPPVPWRPVTKFEQKGLDKDHRICEIWLVRK